MTDSFNGAAPGPNRRRRQPPASPPPQDEAPADLLVEERESQTPDTYFVVEGDVVMAKVVHTLDIDGQESWVTYGLQTRVLEGESEEDVFVRTSSIVNTRVLDLAEDAALRVAEIAERRRQERRQGRIVPR
jgi:hypothetical protein